jgi:hypothetical protein
MKYFSIIFIIFIIGYCNYLPVGKPFGRETKKQCENFRKNILHFPYGCLYVNYTYEKKLADEPPSDQCLVDLALIKGGCQQ